MRRAPEGGYDFGNKRQYRRNVWNTLAGFCDPPRYSRALLMPSSEGDEVEVALSKGFRLDNLHLVDDNPAIAAHLKRRFPLATTYGVRVGRAAERMAKRGITLDAANLDLCACLNERMLTEECRRFTASGVMERGLIALTLLRGREKAIFREITARREAEFLCPTDHLFPGEIRPFGDVAASCLGNDRGRVVLAMEALAGHPDLLQAPYRCFLCRYGTYRSTAGTQSMLWAVIKVHRTPCACDLCLGVIGELILQRTGRGISRNLTFECMAHHASMTKEQLSNITLERGARTPQFRHQPDPIKACLDFYQRRLTKLRETTDFDMDRPNNAA